MVVETDMVKAVDPETGRVGKVLRHERHGHRYVTLLDFGDERSWTWDVIDVRDVPGLVRTRDEVAERVAELQGVLTRLEAAVRSARG